MHIQYKYNGKRHESVKISVNNLLLGLDPFFKEEQKIIRFILLFSFFHEMQNAQDTRIQKKKPTPEEEASVQSRGRKYVY